MKRRGLTLVEVMVSLVLATFVMGTLVVVVSRLLVSNSTAQDHLQNLTTLGRLGEQFRRDAHVATEVRVENGDDQPACLTFQAADEPAIAYTIVPEGLQRVVTAGDEVRGRELFVLSGMKPLGWQLDPKRPEIAMSIGRLARPGSADDRIAGTFSIAAALPAVAKQSPADASSQPPAATPENGAAP